MAIPGLVFIALPSVASVFPTPNESELNPESIDSIKFLSIKVFNADYALMCYGSLVIDFDVVPAFSANPL